VVARVVLGRLALAALVASTAGCNEVRFRHEAAVSFERYPTAAIDPVEVATSDAYARPLPPTVVDGFVAEMRRLSGFRKIIPPGQDATSADLRIAARITGVDVGTQASGTGSCDCEVGPRVTVHAEMTAVDANGQIVYRMVDVKESASGSICPGRIILCQPFSDAQIEAVYEDAATEALHTIAAFFRVDLYV
jgi:hypothetical protein